MGWETIIVNVSAINGTGIDELLEMILLVSEVEELKANPINWQLVLLSKHSLIRDADLLLHYLFEAGTLNVGDPLVVGTTFGRVRALVNDLGRRVKSVWTILLL